MKYYLAIDIGASSGRHIIGWTENGGIKTDEVYRFANQVTAENGHLVWNVEKLFSEIVAGIKKGFEKYPKIESLAIDTWGVDYVLIKDETPVLPVFAYRDDRTADIVDKVHRICDFEYLYSCTGIQYQPFNSIYQLYTDKLNGRLDGVTDILMLPEYFSFLLTGKKIKEYTNATTTGLVNAVTHKFDEDIISALDLPRTLFPDLYEGGTIVGTIKEEIAKQVGGTTKVKLCLSHDTASAVSAIDMCINAPYISSGTWSLVGVKQSTAHVDEKSRKDNFSNEGGKNKSFRYQKNIMGMWVVNRTLNELDGITVQQFQAIAENSDFDCTVDINHEDFLAPVSMIETIKKHLLEHGCNLPQNTADLAACIYGSLAQSYTETIKQIEINLKTNYDKIYIVGGGAKNGYLNRLTEQYAGKRVIALPIEATAIGNLKTQMEI